MLLLIETQNTEARNNVRNNILQHHVCSGLRIGRNPLVQGLGIMLKLILTYSLLALLIGMGLTFTGARIDCAFTACIGTAAMIGGMLGGAAWAYFKGDGAV